MEITYLGHSAFKIKGKNAVLITDPFDEEKTGLKFTKSEADIVTVSHHHADHDKTDNVSNIGKIIDGPGEYEVKGVSIIGISSFHDDKKGAERGKNTIYVIEIDRMRIIHFGDLGHKLDESQIKEIGPIDIALIPVGGVYTIDAKMAVEVANQIAAAIIIPMHYGGNLAPVEDFVKESGMRSEILPKLNIKEGDITSDEKHIVILEKK